jgi:hypothetical protein
MLYVQVTDDQSGATYMQSLTKDFLQSLPQSVVIPPPPTFATVVLRLPDVILDSGPDSQFAFTIWTPDGVPHQVTNHTIGVGVDVAQSIADDINRLGGTDLSPFSAVVEGNYVRITCVNPGPVTPPSLDGAIPSGLAISQVS